ncbi:hypothetical protein [Vibrio diazotrophicus]|uniref:hypothetical protein n=1 Tax=Vibrio diazotrophicus TaxID=685 RepID=UPI000DD64A7F|nr:hypothetical protein [Vibrio diazotrophicus]
MKTSINNNYHLDLNNMLSLEVNQAAKWVLLVSFEWLKRAVEKSIASSFKKKARSKRAAICRCS